MSCMPYLRYDTCYGLAHNFMQWTSWLGLWASVLIIEKRVILLAIFKFNCTHCGHSSSCGSLQILQNRVHLLAFGLGTMLNIFSSVSRSSWQLSVRLASVWQ